MDQKSGEFLKELNHIFSHCFEKIRVTNKIQKDPIQELMEVKLNLKISLKIENNEEMIKFINKKIEDIDQILVEYSGEENRGIVEEYVKNLDSESGGFCQLGMWKIKSKVCPKTTDPPTAKKDKFGNLN